MSRASADFVRGTTSARSISIPELGLHLTVRLEAAATGAALEILDTVNAPGFGPPRHRHPQTEVFLVQEGKYLFEVGGKTFDASAGDIITVPGGTPHAFRNMADFPSRQTVLVLPAMGSHMFFSELARLLEGPHTPTDLAALGRRWNIEFLP